MKDGNLQGRNRGVKGKPSFASVVKKTGLSLLRMSPVILGVVLLVGLADAVIPKSAYFLLFSKNEIADAFIGAAVGSILAGSPITSYILGGEFLAEGISLFAVTAFIVAWVTVGIVQLPAESAILGKRFAVTRNITAFLLSILVALLTVMGVGLL